MNEFLDKVSELLRKQGKSFPLYARFFDGGRTAEGLSLVYCKGSPQRLESPFGAVLLCFVHNLTTPWWQSVSQELSQFVEVRSAKKKIVKFQNHHGKYEIL